MKKFLFTIVVLTICIFSTVYASNVAGTGGCSCSPSSATCTSASVCTICGALYSPALGHSMTSSSKSATCTESGYYKTWCTRCGGNGSTTTYSALGHNYSSYDYDYDEHWLCCSRCDETTSYGEHYDNDDGDCNTCGYTMYYAPSAPKITVKDTKGNEITSTWTNKDLLISVGGSSLTKGRGGFDYKYKLNNGSYKKYSNPVSYTSINTDTVFYGQAYNTSATYMYKTTSKTLPKIEKTPPTFSISIDSNEYERSHTATLKFADEGGSNLKADIYTVSYVWTKSASTPSNYDYTMEVTPPSAKTHTATITKNTGTGIYHLHVKLNKKITDNATNACEITTLTIPFYMDNTSPVIEQKSIDSNPTAMNAQATYSMDFIITEEHSGLVTDSFTEDDIIIKVNGVKSSATKN